jgi:hypothetical protein
MSTSEAFDRQHRAALQAAVKKFFQEQRGMDPFTVSAQAALLAGEALLEKTPQSELARWYAQRRALERSLFQDLWDVWRRIEAAQRTPVDSANLWDGGGSSWTSAGDESTTMIMMDVGEKSELVAMVDRQLPALAHLFCESPCLLKAAQAVCAWADEISHLIQTTPTAEQENVLMALADLKNAVRRAMATPQHDDRGKMPLTTDGE